MSDAIRLYSDQTAAPQTCGSCLLFNRAPTDPRWLDQAPICGTCSLKFPPWVKLLHTYARSPERGEVDEVFENSSDARRVRDHETCSFWRPAGAIYVKDQTWSVA